MLTFLRLIINKIRLNRVKKGFGKLGNNIIFGRRIFLIGKNRISIGDDTVIGEGVYLTAWQSYSFQKTNGQLEEQKFLPEIIIGSNCIIGKDAHITAINRIVIGKGCLLGHNVTITDNSHGEFSEEMLRIQPSLRKLISKGAVVIDENVWIGSNVTILSDVHIGKNVVIGANAVVTKSVPPNSMVAGNPARIIKQINLPKCEVGLICER